MAQSLSAPFESELYNLQAYQASSRTIAPILPKLAQEMSAEKESQREAALQFVGQVLAVPQTQLDVEQPDIFSEFLKRALDIEVSSIESLFGT